MKLKCVLLSSLKCLLETFVILRKNQRAIVLNVSTSSYKVSVIVVRYKKIEFYQQILEKSSNIKFHENLTSGSRAVLCGLTDGHM